MENCNSISISATPLILAMIVMVYAVYLRMKKRVLRSFSALCVAFSFLGVFLSYAFINEPSRANYLIATTLIISCAIIIVSTVYRNNKFKLAAYIISGLIALISVLASVDFMIMSDEVMNTVGTTTPEVFIAFMYLCLIIVGSIVMIIILWPQEKISSKKIKITYWIFVSLFFILSFLQIILIICKS